MITQVFLLLLGNDIAVGNIIGSNIFYEYRHCVTKKIV